MKREHVKVSQGESLSAVLVKVISDFKGRIQIMISQKLTRQITNRQGGITSTEKLYLFSVKPNELVLRKSGKEEENVVIEIDPKRLCFHEITSFLLEYRTFQKVENPQTIIYVETDD